MANVALVPKRDIFQGDMAVSPNDPRKAAQTLAGDRIALVRHGRAPLLAFTEKFFDLQDLRALKMPKLRRPAVDARSNQRQREQKFRVPVTLDDLGRNRRRPQPQLLADACFDLWIKMRV